MTIGPTLRRLTKCCEAIDPSGRRRTADGQPAAPVTEKPACSSDQDRARMG